MVYVKSVIGVSFGNGKMALKRTMLTTAPSGRSRIVGDRSQVRRRQRPHAMATVRNVAISLLRLAGADSIAAATRYLGRQTERPLRLLGLV